MAKTIIQPIGPLYGETVNGTVFGRPNGSVYVPASNTIALSIPASNRYIKNNASPVGLVICTSTGTIKWSDVGLVAQSQDIANAMVTEVSETADFSGTIYKRTFSAGAFNTATAIIAFTSDLTIVAGTTYYVRARLVTGSNVAVATSDVIEVEGVA